MEAVELLGAICSGVGADVGELWVYERASSTLRPLDPWCSPALDATDLMAVTRATSFTTGMGLVGTVWQRNEPVWIREITDDARFLRAAAATSAGLHTAIGWPIVDGGELLAILVILRRDVLDVDRTMLERLVTVGAPIARYLRRRRAARLAEERTRDNHELVTSLLALQADRFAAPEVRRAFEATQLRLQAIELASRGDIGRRLELICDEVFRWFAIDPDRVGLVVDVAAAEVTADLAVPCGLIVNELVVNALHHAFPDGRRGAVAVRLRGHDGGIRLEVSDDGVGLPADIDPATASTLGLTLVRDLADQLRATVQVMRVRGTTFAIGMPMRVRELV